MCVRDEDVTTLQSDSLKELQSFSNMTMFNSGEDCQHLPYCDKSIYQRALEKLTFSILTLRLGSNGNRWMGRQRKVIYQRFVL